MNVRITGIQGLRSSMSRLPDALRKAAERSVLRSGGKVILASAKAKVPVGKYGLLKKSLGINVKRMKGVFSARIGPRSGLRKKIGTAIARKTKKGRTKGQEYDVFVSPNKYAHLVEFGTSHSPAKPFIRPAMDSASSEVLAAMSTGLDSYLTKVAARLAAR